MTQDGMQQVSGTIHRQIDNCERVQSNTKQNAQPTSSSTNSQSGQRNCATGEGYWQMRFEQLQTDYEHLQKVNQNLEEKLLIVVEEFERKKEQLITTVEYEKSALMVDVDKISNKLVEAQIKLNDYEENEILHAANCNSACHQNRWRLNDDKMRITSDTRPIMSSQQSQADQMANDPNII